ncbi:glycoside hydrolase family 2 protein [Zasmidium cellare ATCC 36951]|uniref:Beta-mannosidase A n=1 Tax=Zasmidium cellare ATCC 36951 TaxID=1080233 RepID=A0A6A6CXW5_ZASCE|nr:glycoside hydrolase family 2 protein [Zasmidium cellare ATCC 36951]KAF2170649.1 glycoside hydrolase family 2 protein [Zasmidium cellare ATCC 36951]
MWKSAVISLLSLAGPSFAQFNSHWGGWHPGPSSNHDQNNAKVIDLSGNGWTLKSQNGSISVPASIPSQQYIDLYASNTIDDPLYGLNNVNLDWVRDQNWTYSRSVSQLRTGGPRGGWRGGQTSTYLVFEGLDTFTTITFCGKVVGATENMYRQYTFDVTDVLSSCRGAPQLSLNFGPAVPITHAISEGPDQDGTVNFADSCNNSTDAELSCKAYARKEQNDFGWDWSPALVPAGPWRPLYAVQITRNQLYINNAAIDIYRKGQQNNLPPDQSQPWIFNASIDFTGDLPRGSSMQLTLSDQGGRQILQKRLGGVYSSSNTISGSTTIDPSSVQLWWPSGMGSQPLYNAKVDILSGGGRFGSNSIANAERRVGFRTIVLNLGAITPEQLARGIGDGANWHFEVNGKEFYAKGSNLVPPDVFWPRVDDGTVQNLFQLVKDANMNMLRVWSSGAYLDDWIYDIADEMGIFLWSEFEFTDATYPNNDRYFAEYEAEAYYNVRRVNYHPSLALWAGGNELEAVINQYGIGKENYEMIQLQILIKCVYANTKSISYIPSSTYNGYISLDFNSVRPQTPRYLSGTPGNFYNDTDTYQYDAPTLFDFNTYPEGRFADEFGYISFPSIQTWELEAPESDLYVESPTVVNHNRHVPFGAAASDDVRVNAALRVIRVPESQSLQGIHEITASTHLYLPAPNLADSKANFTAWCYSTQIIHADAMAHQIAFYRRGSGMPERNLGSLYWQFNDLWAAPTWASVEASGRQKLLYYTAKDIFSPVIVYPYWNRNTTDLAIYVTSDLQDSVSGTMSYQWVDYKGNPLSVGGTVTIEGHRNGTGNNGTQPSQANRLNFNVGAINTTEVLHYPSLQTTFSNSNVSMDNAVLILSIQAGQYTHKQFFHPANLIDVDLPDPGLTLRQSGNGFTVTATKGVAAWVWLEYDTNAVQGSWSENGFWLNKGESKDVTFTVISGGGDWASSVSVRSVWDNLGR